MRLEFSNKLTIESIQEYYMKWQILKQAGRQTPLYYVLLLLSVFVEAAAEQASQGCDAHA